MWKALSDQISDTRMDLHSGYKGHRGGSTMHTYLGPWTPEMTIEGSAMAGSNVRCLKSMVGHFNYLMDTNSSDPINLIQYTCSGADVVLVQQHWRPSSSSAPVQLTTFDENCICTCWNLVGAPWIMLRSTQQGQSIIPPLVIKFLTGKLTLANR